MLKINFLRTGNIDLAFFMYVIFSLDDDCRGDDNCCSPEHKCRDGHGDCDSNFDCLSGLCRDNNCDTGAFHTFDSLDDCCVATNGKFRTVQNPKAGHSLCFWIVLCAY